MKTITAYKCQHCGKVYEKNMSCKSHENKCYFNPKTCSCASCAFKIIGDYQMPNKSYTSIRTCLRNVNITERLRTKCQNYLGNTNPDANKYIQENETSYFPEVVIRKYMEKIMRLSLNTDNEEVVIKRKEELCEGFYGIYMNHLMVTILNKMHLKPTTNLDNKDIEIHFDAYMQFFKLTERIFVNLGFEESRIKSLIYSISDIWNLEGLELNKARINGFIAILDNGAQLKDFLLANENNVNAFEIFKSFDIKEIKGLLKNNQFSFFDETPREYYLNFERIVKSIDPDFISDLKRLVDEIVHLK